MAQNIRNNNKITNDNNASDSNKIVLLTSVKSLSDFENKSKTPLSSTIHIIGGLSWRMEVQKGALPRKLDLYVFCNESVKDTLWLCKVQFKLFIQTPERFPARDASTLKYGPFYGFNTYYWVLENFCGQQFLLERADEKIEIQLEINISYFQKSFPQLDTTLLIKIGEDRTETFFINKHLLCSFSKYFDNLFFGDWSDNKKTQYCFEINEIEDFDALAFGFMIYSVMTMGGIVAESNFMTNCHYSISIKLLKLAIKYDVVILMDYCEKLLIGCKNFSKMELLELAEQYSLSKLKKHCLNEMSILDYMKDLAMTADIHSQLSNDTQQQLNAILARKSNEMKNSLMALNGVFCNSNHPLVSSSVADHFNKMITVFLGQQEMAVNKATNKPE